MIWLTSSIKWLKNPVVMIYLLSIILFSIVLFLTYKIRPFNSDDVFWQVILMNGWLPYDGSTVTLGNSSIHIDKLPLYWLSDLFGLTGRKALFAQSLVVGVASFTAFYWSSVYLIKKLLTKTKLSFTSLLPFLWLAGFGYLFFTLYLDPNWRGFQISFALVLFALTYALWRGEITLRSIVSKIVLLLLTIYVGLLIYGDPYILYFAILPLAAFTLLSYYPLRKIRLHTAIITLLAIIATFIFSKVFAALGSAAGVHISLPSDVYIVGFSQFADNIGYTIHSLLTIFGADFFGMVVGKHIILLVINFIILAIITYAIYRVAKRSLHKQKKETDTSWLLFLITTLVITVVFYMFTTMNQGVTTYRYLLFTVLLCVVVFSYFISTIQNKKIIYTIAGLLLLSIVLSVATTAKTSVPNQANQDNYQLVSLLKETGYTKGYAGYWDAGINSYLSDGEIKVLPTICSTTAIVQWHWLINDNAYATKTDKSFYIYNSLASGLGSQCTLEMVTKQLGEASRTIVYKNQTIYLYDYDITSRL